MSKYEKLDELIICAVTNGESPLYENGVRGEAGRIAKEEKREEFRVTDARLQALKKAGKIHYAKATKTSKSGWKLGDGK